MTSEEIKRKLWEGANELRGAIDASKYKDYMLGLMFYKFLSEKTLEEYRNIADKEELTTSELLAAYHEEYANEEYREDILSLVKNNLGYVILPEHLYHRWLQDIKAGEFELQKVQDSLDAFERSISEKDADKFKGLFSKETMNLSPDNHSEYRERSNNIKALVDLFSDINMISLQHGDVLGDAYEYLIGQFASDAGKKAGEFYTPRQVSEVMARIVARTTTFNEYNPSIYDPTVGSGSLLLTVRKHLPLQTQQDLHYYGQEYLKETYNLTRMNLLLHGVKTEKMTIKRGNTLAEDWPEDPTKPGVGFQFDAVVMNPPYSDSKWNSRDKDRRPLTVSDPRFADFGALPPDSKGDFAYLMHGFYHLSQQGTMAIVLPHGVLFRGSSEGDIRRRLLEKNYIDAVIGLPANLFTNTGIPVCIIVLKKNRSLEAPVMMIDASKGFIKVGKQNVLQEKDTAKIVDTYVDQLEIPGYSHLATREEIARNEYNLNIPRYVEAIDDEIPHDVDGHLYGGIPRHNLASLKMLQTLVPDILANSLREVRPNYVELNTSTDAISTAVMNDPRVTRIGKDLQVKMEAYVTKWWETLHQVDKSTELTSLQSNMLREVKEILSDFHILDVYDAYQIIATLWDNFLTHDIELMADNGFYEAARKRTRRPSKKKSDTEEWDGLIIPNDLIESILYKEEQAEIQSLKDKIESINGELEEIKESLSEDEGENQVLNEANTDFDEKSLKKVLDEAYEGIMTDEMVALNEYIALLDAKAKKDEKLAFINVHHEVNWSLMELNKDGTAGKGVVNKRLAAIRSEYIFEEGSFESKVMTVLDHIQTRKALSSEIKEQEKALKEAVYARIPELTNDEIDELLWVKWFGQTTEQVVSLVEKPIKKELSTLSMLQERYASTLTHLDDEISELEKSLDELLNDLVVVE